MTDEKIALRTLLEKGSDATFLRGPIEGDWPYIWLDATYVKARRDHHIVSVAVIVAVGVNTDGRREVLGMTRGHSEAEPFWVEFLRSLARRGLRGAKLVISDAHEGLKAAIVKVLGAKIANRELLVDIRRVHPFIERIFADAGYQGPCAARAAANTGRWVFEIVKRNELHKFICIS